MNRATHSYWPADNTHPVLETTVGSVLRDAADAAPERTAIVAWTVTPGERRTWTYSALVRDAECLEEQPGPFILKVDRRNGGSSHLVFGTEDLAPGEKIERHRHPGSDEILLLQSGRARVSLGDMVREVHGGSTVFIPANTWIAVTNIGTDAMSLVFVFSAPGFEDFMRAESVPEGQKVTPLSKAEDAAIMKEHAHAVIYAEP